MDTNSFYKTLAAFSTVGILAAAGATVPMAFKKGNTAEDQLAKTIVELRNARKDALDEVKAARKDILSEVKTAKSDALKAIKKAGGSDEDIVWLLLRFGAVPRGGGFLEKIPMKDMSQCELQGAIFTGSKRLWPTGDARGFECIEGK